MFKSKIIILGIGNRLKSDDGFGSILAERLNSYQNENLKIIDCGEVPENYIREIFDFKPDSIVIIDALYVPDKAVGEVLILEEGAKDVPSISTHAGSLELFLDVLKMQGLSFNSFLLGIIPENVQMGEDISEQVQKGIEDILKKFPEYLKKFSLNKEDIV
ncbi:MAG: hydrogenase maturation protease [Candidatus Saelkia tenebricola]|nr:hydrogenase maturation protease [Candidatus Saelkia tenebricola]